MATMKYNKLTPVGSNGRFIRQSSLPNLPASDYLRRFWSSKDIRAIAVDEYTIETYKCKELQRETVDTYRLLNAAKRRGYSISRTDKYL